MVHRQGMSESPFIEEFVHRQGMSESPLFIEVFVKNA
jgi:hypothetical protein